MKSLNLNLFLLLFIIYYYLLFIIFFYYSLLNHLERYFGAGTKNNTYSMICWCNPQRNTVRP